MQYRNSKGKQPDMTKHVLLVSDSLGTPIHARGIYNFTVGLVQSLKRLSCHVTLLVEPPRTGLLAEDCRASRGALNQGSQRTYFADMFKHFEGERFRFDWHYGDPRKQDAAQKCPRVVNFELAMGDIENVRHSIRLRMEPGREKRIGVSNYSEHLWLFDEILLQREVYSESMRRGYLNLRPVVVDCAGFDYVIVDTPHYISVDGVRPEKVAYVIHDLIPMDDATMGFDWRVLFARKVACTIAIGRSAIFNSQCTRHQFKQVYGSDVVDRDVVIYPGIREEVMQAAAGCDRRPPSNYIRDIQANKIEEQQQWVDSIRSRLQTVDATAEKQLARAKWNGNLPFFCSVLSDEPRKNIAAIVEASKSFVGRANFVVMGQIDGSLYMAHRPEDHPNLHFTGYVSDVQKFDLLRSCMAFIFPSIAEGFGIPIVEAAMFGAPVICTDVEVFREITYGRAYYFDANKKGDLERVIAKVMADGTRDEKGSELRKHVQRSFVGDRVVDSLAELLA
jgi:glycosyltransferase involved in cell wall biosynthesis